MVDEHDQIDTKDNVVIQPDLDVKAKEAEQFQLMQFLAFIGMWFIHHQKKTYHELIEKDSTFGKFLDFDVFPEKFILSNEVFLVKLLSDIKAPVSVRVVGGTLEKPSFVSVSSGDKHDTIEQTITVATTFDFTTVARLDDVANDAYFDTDQDVTVAINGDPKTFTVSAGERLKIDTQLIRTMTITPTVSTNITILVSN